MGEEIQGERLFVTGNASSICLQYEGRERKKRERDPFKATKDSRVLPLPSPQALILVRGFDRKAALEETLVSELLFRGPVTWQFL